MPINADKNHTPSSTRTLAAILPTERLIVRNYSPLSVGGLREAGRGWRAMERGDVRQRGLRQPILYCSCSPNKKDLLTYL